MTIELSEEDIATIRGALETCLVGYSMAATPWNEARAKEQECLRVIRKLETHADS